MKVKIKVESTDCFGEIMRTETNAILEDREHDHKISYVENLSEDNIKTRTTIYISSSSMRIIRDGEIKSDLIFSNGLQHNTNYNTPFGSIPVCVETKRYDFVGRTGNVSDDMFASDVPNPFGKRISIDAYAEYSIITEGAEPMDMKVKLKVES